jgi:hypothetical protein
MRITPHRADLFLKSISDYFIAFSSILPYLALILNITTKNQTMCVAGKWHGRVGSAAAFGTMVRIKAPMMEIVCIIFCSVC